ncbi:MAG: thioredoxin-disulfide reductase [Lachnospiraceae bacterium]|nr:thioredoxin-disulfide reductase [Lachnospiraceae bacterium]
MYDLIIIGSGPAGLSAAVYGKRAGFSTLVIEENPMSGGQVLNTYEVDNYLGLPGISGFEMGMQFREHADRLGAEFTEGRAEQIEKCGQTWKVTTTEGIFEAKAVILAAGATHRHLEVPGEEAFSGRGVSYCATCDGAFFRNKVTAVVGGGDVAVEDAVFLARSCKKVYLIHRRDELRAAKSLQEQLFALPNVEILYHHTVKEICGEQKVASLVLHNVQTQEETTLETDGVFIAVGITPQTAQFAKIADMDEAGYLIAGEDCKTSVPGLYAAGDIRTKKLRQIITAAADGANAVASAEEYLRELYKI